MTETKQMSTAKTDCRPDHVTETRMGNPILTVSSFFKQDTANTAANRVAKVLEVGIAIQKTAI